MQPRPPARPGNRTVWIVLGAFALCFTCCCGGLLLGVFGYRRGTEADREAKAFATSAVTAIGKGWSDDAFRRYASPSLQPLVGSKKTNLYVTAWRKKLGSLKRLDEFTTGGVFFGSQPGLPSATRVNLSAPATFEKGSGTITLRVAKADGRWGIENLDVRSDALLK